MTKKILIIITLLFLGQFYLLSLDKNPRFSQLFYNISLHYHNENNIIKSKDYLNESLKKNPQNKKALELKKTLSNE